MMMVKIVKFSLEALEHALSIFHLLKCIWMAFFICDEIVNYVPIFVLNNWSLNKEFGFAIISLIIFHVFISSRFDAVIR